MRKSQKDTALSKKSKKMLVVGAHGFIRRLTHAEQRAQAKFILNNWGL